MLKESTIHWTQAQQLDDQRFNVQSDEHHGSGVDPRSPCLWDVGCRWMMANGLKDEDAVSKRWTSFIQRRGAKSQKNEDIYSTSAKA